MNLFVLVALPPGSRKTAVFADIARPVIAFEDVSIKTQAPIRETAKNRRSIVEQTIRRVQSEAAKATGSKRDQLISQADKLAVELASLEIPALLQLITDDCTPEKLSNLLKEQNGRIAIMSAEGDIFDIIAGRYSSQGQANLGVFLKGHAGDDIRVDRLGRSADYIKKPALTIGLAVQPTVLRGLMSKPGFLGRGLLGRFLYSLPKSLIGYRKTDAPPIPAEVRNSYEQKISALLKAGEECTANNPLLLTFSREGLNEFVRFEQEIEAQLHPFGSLSTMSDWAGKLPGAIARIAGLLHVTAYPDATNLWPEPIRLEVVKQAISLAPYLISHAKVAYQEMGSDPAIEGAKYLVSYIQKSNLMGFSKRDLFNFVRGRFRQVADLEQPLKVLEEYGYIRKQSQHDFSNGPGRKRSPTYKVNPFSHNAQYTQR